MFNYRVKFYDKTVHAGTFPMPKRCDALYAASKALCYLHEKIDALDSKSPSNTVKQVGKEDIISIYKSLFD